MITKDKLLAREGTIKRDLTETGLATACPGKDSAEAAIIAIAELAAHARARHLTIADELLVEFLLILFTRAVAPSCEERLAAEDRAMAVLRLLWMPRGPQ